MFAPYINFFSNPQVHATLKIIYYASYVLVPVGLSLLIADLWLAYRRAMFFAKQTYTLLEVKLPREIFKSPLAMELFLNGLYQTSGETTFIDRLWNGQVRAWFSLEIVSIEGAVHFFIWTRAGFKNLIEANLYSQFPGIEVHEVPDYTLPVSFDPEKVGLWGTEFDLTKADPFPIKTYVDYGMDKDPKEEYKIDPMTPMVEFLGSLGRGQQVWYQILIRAHKAEDKDPEGSGKLVDLKWQKGAQKEIEDILKKTKGEKGEDGKIIPGSTRFPTEGENAIIKALERSVSKIGFDVGIRAIYTAPQEIFAPENIAGVTGSLRNYNSNNLNGFKPARVTGGKYDYPWQDRKKVKTNREKQHMLDAYKKRAYFYNEHKSPPFVLNTEELATIFHFPGLVSTTPTFERIDSRKAEAPANLPV